MGSIVAGVARILGSFSRSAERVSDTDVRLLQSILNAQIQRIDQVDAVLTASGMLMFGAMTSLLVVNDVRTGTLVARLLAVALMGPISATGIALLRYVGLDAPDLDDLDAGLRVDRTQALELARVAIVDAFRINRRVLAAKKAVRAWAVLCGAGLVLADLLGFMVHW
jgi:hypothetical protein